MQFISQNYIYFIVVGVIILLAIIGYIAEKTDFFRKEREPKKVKNNVIKKEEPSLESLEGKTLMDAVDVGKMDEVIKQKDEIKQENTIEEIDASLFEPLVPVDTIKEEIDSSVLEMPIVENKDSLLGDTTVIEPIEEQQEIIEQQQDILEPVNIDEETEVNTPDLPNIDDLKNQDNLEDDVWKF